MIDSILTATFPDIHTINDSDAEAIKNAIDREELIALALTLGNIPSRSGQELAAANFVHQWCLDNHFATRMVAMIPERPNVVAEYGGKGLGANLLFNAHLDTESPLYDGVLDHYKFTEKTLGMREWRECWLDDGHLHGFALTNDRGPMSCFLMAAKALQKAGIDLAGKVYLTASSGEIGPEPVEEQSGLAFVGKELGTHYLFNHGGVCPDYALVAEGTDFGVTWQASGYVLFRITLFGEGVFTPALNHPEDPGAHPNPLHRLGSLIDMLSLWCREYEQTYSWTSPGGTSIAKAQIDSVRGGVPQTFGAGTEVCHLYLDVVLPPKLKASVVERSLRALLQSRGIGEFALYPCVVRHGFVADDQVHPLVNALGSAVERTLGHPLEIAHPVYSSMWRDHNVFNMNGVPAVTFGFPRQSPTPDDLVNCTFIYALTMLSLCGRA